LEAAVGEVLIAERTVVGAVWKRRTDDRHAREVARFHWSFSAPGHQ
jgi:hypothetical protein